MKVGFKEELREHIDKRIEDIYFANSQELFKMALEENWGFEQFQAIIFLKILEKLEMMTNDKRKFS